MERKEIDRARAEERLEEDLVEFDLYMKECGDCETQRRQTIFCLRLVRTRCVRLPAPEELRLRILHSLPHRRSKV